MLSSRLCRLVRKPADLVRLEHRTMSFVGNLLLNYRSILDLLAHLSYGKLEALLSFTTADYELFDCFIFKDIKRFKDLTFKNRKNTC